MCLFYCFIAGVFRIFSMLGLFIQMLPSTLEVKPTKAVNLNLLALGISEITQNQILLRLLRIVGRIYTAPRFDISNKIQCRKVNFSVNSAITKYCIVCFICCV